MFKVFPSDVVRLMIHASFEIVTITSSKKIRRQKVFQTELCITGMFYNLKVKNK